MTDERKKTKWPLALLVMLLLYPLSIGPATWLEQHNYLPSAVMRVYQPFWNIRVDAGPGRLLRRWELFWRDL